MNEIDNIAPIDLDNPGAYGPLLKNVQGNIVKGHARDLANHIFITFTGGAAAARNWLRTLEPEVTSAFQQQQDSNEFKRSRRDDLPFLSVFLTAAGYGYLGLTGAMPPEQGGSFRAGMRKTGRVLNDLPPDEWRDPNWRKLGQPATALHAMVLTANDNGGRLRQDTERIIHSLKGLGEFFVESGKMLYPDGDKTKPREHFGYIDGISNPIFDKEDLEKEDGYQTDDGGWRFSSWDPFAPLNLVLVRESGASPAEPRYGSFLVFRKLEQNVRDFRADILQLSANLARGGAAQARAMALVMGRFPDGTPVTVHPNSVSSHPFANDFSYVSAGGRCPFRGHIRRANPRGEQEPPREEEAMRRIARRGIPYGDRARDLSDSPADGVGLLFMCYQSDIARHFEHIQKEWCNWEFNFDAIVGQGRVVKQLPPIERERNTEWPRKWATTAEEMNNPVADWPAHARLDNFEFGRYVTLKGGEYFFAPSKPSLRDL
ncbi:MAG: Dyp-type peroxidase [Nitrospiraceae bacterium]